MYTLSLSAQASDVQSGAALKDQKVYELVCGGLPRVRVNATSLQIYYNDCITQVSIEHSSECVEHEDGFDHRTGKDSRIIPCQYKHGVLTVIEMLALKKTDSLSRRWKFSAGRRGQDL
jgi:hypothetical protein